MIKNIYLDEKSIDISLPCWLARVSYNDKLECEFEEFFHSYAGVIFPDYHCVYFKIKISSKSGATIPDFALISKDYSEWVIGEVETTSHDIINHILPQLKKFSLGEYDAAGIIEKLCDNHSFLDKGKINELFQNREPEILVISNEYKDDWEISLHKRGYKYISLELYNSSNKGNLIQICGDNITARKVKLALGRNGPIVLGFQTIILDRFLDEIEGKIAIESNGTREEWQHIKESSSSLLMPCFSFKKTKDSYLLYKDSTKNQTILE